MQWSQLKKRVQEKLACSVRDRIEFGSTCYRRSHDQKGRGWISIDGKEILNLCSVKFGTEQYRTVREEGRRDYEVIAQEFYGKNLFAQWDLYKALFEYLNLSIVEISSSENHIIRAVGMLDSRLGKRRLRAIDVSDEHDLVRRLYFLRCEAEQIPVPNVSESGLTDRLEAKWKKKESITREEKGRIAAEKLSLSNRTRNLRNLLSSISENKILEQGLNTEIARELYSGFEAAENRDLLFGMLKCIESKSKLLNTSEYVKGIIALSRDPEHWVRKVEEWSPRTHNLARQFSSLARHLWASYDVPVFMDNAWIHDNASEQGWFKHIGSGNNIRNADHLPILLTKRMAHHFLSAPDSYTPQGALRWAQVHALGGSKRLSDALLGTILGREFRDDAFWLGVIRFFIRNPMLDPAQIGPIVDYIWSQKYENRVIFINAGVAEEIGPEQPNFSIRGRTVEALLKAVEGWHRRLGKETKGGQLQWKESGIREFSYMEGNKDSHNMRIWCIRELLSSRELIAEGRCMRHCVASYASSCHSGVCSIWGLSVETETETEKLLTMEVNNPSKEIRQIRGKRNRLATEKEREVVTRWADREGLTLASYV